MFDKSVATFKGKETSVYLEDAQSVFATGNGSDVDNTWQNESFIANHVFYLHLFTGQKTA